MDKLKPTGQNLGRVFHCRLSHTCMGHTIVHITKQPNLKLKTRPKQLLGSLPLAFVLPRGGQLYWTFTLCYFSLPRHKAWLKAFQLQWRRTKHFGSNTWWPIVFKASRSSSSNSSSSSWNHSKGHSFSDFKGKINMRCFANTHRWDHFFSFPPWVAWHRQDHFNLRTNFANVHQP
jgi:hypothetical protein